MPKHGGHGYSFCVIKITSFQTHCHLLLVTFSLYLKYLILYTSVIYEAVYLDRSNRCKIKYQRYSLPKIWHGWMHVISFLKATIFASTWCVAWRIFILSYHYFFLIYFFNNIRQKFSKSLRLLLIVLLPIVIVKMQGTRTKKKHTMN